MCFLPPRRPPPTARLLKHTRYFRLIKEFEREARTDGMPPLDLATRKKTLVSELNGYITAKKDFTTAAAQKADLTGASSPRGGKLAAARSQEGEQPCRKSPPLPGPMSPTFGFALQLLHCPMAYSASE